MMTNSIKSSTTTNPQFQELDDDMDSAVNAVLQEESNVKVEKFPQ